MASKSFIHNTALRFIQAPNDAQEATHEATQEATQEAAQEVMQGRTPKTAQEAAPKTIREKPQKFRPSEKNRKPYTRTQGRKGCKKPRINLALDSEELLSEVRSRAEDEGMSITQFVNEAIYMRLENIDIKW